MVAGIIAKRRGYPIAARPTLAMVWDTFLKAAPSLALIVVIMVGNGDCRLDALRLWRR